MSDGYDTPKPSATVMPPTFSIEIKPQRGTVEVSPVGELDLATTPQLKSKLEALIDVGCARIVIDLRRVEFLDSSALHALVSAQTCAERDGWHLAIIPGRRAVQRVFELTGTVDHLPFIGSTAS